MVNTNDRAHFLNSGRYFYDISFHIYRKFDRIRDVFSSLLFTHTTNDQRNLNIKSKSAVSLHLQTRLQMEKKFRRRFYYP